MVYSSQRLNLGDELVTVQEIIEKMGDYSIPSERILEMAKAFLADKYDDFGNIIPPTHRDYHEMEHLRDALTKLRPVAMKMLWRYTMEMDADCPIHSRIDIDALEKKLFPNN